MIGIKKGGFGAICLVTSFLFTSFASATGAISIDSPELQKGYSLYSDLTSVISQTTVQYGEGIRNTIVNNPKSCTEKAMNKGNNGEVFIFANCSFPNVSAPTFSANTNLLNLWQVGEEDIQASLTNKAKHYIYSKLFTALRNNYAYNQGYTKYEQDNAQLSILNSSYFSKIEELKKGVPETCLNIQSGDYKMTALDMLWQTPEIAPKQFYSEDQYNRYKKFETVVLTVAKKVQAINNKNSLTKLNAALLKILKDTKGIMENDRYVMLAIIQQMVAEKL